MKKGLMLFVLIIGLAGSVSAQTKVLKPTLQKSRSAPSAITVVYPNGGETIIQGSRQTIQWKVTGTSPALRIELLRNGKTVHTIAKNYSAAKGKLVWNVGEVQPGGGYTIRIIAASGGLRAASKRPFSIVASAARAFGATQPGKLKPAPYASGVPEISGAKTKTANARTLSPAKGEQSPAPGVPGPEQKVARPWLKEYQRYGGESPPSATRPFFGPEQKVAKPWSKEYQRYGGESPPSAMRPFFGPEDSPPGRESPVVTYDNEQSSPYQRQNEAKLPEQPGAWSRDYAETPARQENLPTTSMETELATFPDFEVARMMFEPKIRRLHIEIANFGTKDHLDAPLELRWQLDNVGPEVIRKDHWTLRKGEKKFWGITLDRRWHWPRDRGRLRCDVTADPNDNILEAKEDNNRHALWFYKTSGPDVNLAADHILVGSQDKVFPGGEYIELGRSDACDSNKERHIFAFDVKMQLVNYGDQAVSGSLQIITCDEYDAQAISSTRISLQKGETRWFTIRRWMGVIYAGSCPIKVTWGDDKRTLFEGKIAHLRDLVDWLGCLPNLGVFISEAGFGDTHYSVGETIPLEIIVWNEGDPIQEEFLCRVEVIKKLNFPQENTEAQSHIIRVDGMSQGERKTLHDSFIPETHGYYFVQAVVDPDHRIREYSESEGEQQDSSKSKDFRVYP